MKLFWFAPFLAGLALTNPATAPRPQEFAPLAYFEKNCANCHGPSGDFYTPSHMAKHSDARLRQFIADMAQGPGQAPLNETQLAIETAFHRSLIDGKPFVILSSLKRHEAAWHLVGEVSPGASVTLETDKTKTPATVADFTWHATLPRDANLAMLRLIAKRGEAVTTLGAAEGYSHQK